MPLRIRHRTPGCREFAMDSVKIVEGKAKPRSSSRGDQPAKSVGAICLTLQRRARFRLRFGTSLERNTPESLTRALYGFVHGDIWEPARGGTPDGVWRACAGRALFRQTLTRGRVGKQQESRAGGPISPKRAPASGWRRTALPSTPPGRSASAPRHGSAP